MWSEKRFIRRKAKTRAISVSSKFNYPTNEITVLAPKRATKAKTRQRPISVSCQYPTSTIYLVQLNYSLITKGGNPNRFTILECESESRFFHLKSRLMLLNEFLGYSLNCCQNSFDQNGKRQVGGLEHMSVFRGWFLFIPNQETLTFGSESHASKRLNRC